MEPMFGMESILEIVDYCKHNQVLFIVVIVLILIAALALFFLKAWKSQVLPMIEKYTKEKQEEENRENLINSHTEEISNLYKEIVDMRSSMEQSTQQMKEMIESNATHMQTMIDYISEYNKGQTRVLKDQLKHSILRACTDYMFQGTVKSSDLASLIDMYNRYKGDPINGNTYVHDRVKEVCIGTSIIKDGSEEFLKEPLFTFLEEEGLDLSDVHFIKQSEVPGMVI